MTWIRMDCSAPDDLIFDQLGDALGIESMQAFGHYFAVAGKLATLGTDGRLDTVLDRTLEQWAKWTGTRGGFAGVFRGFCQDPETGELRGFRRRNEKLLHKQAADRQKRKNRPPDGPTSGNPQETPEGFSRVPAGNPRANGNGNDIKESLPSSLERRVKRQVISSDEQAVVDHYRGVHPKRLRGAIPEKVLRLLRQALKSYPVADLCRAIDGNAASQFHRDGGHLGLDLILRDASKIDYFLDLAQRAANESLEMTDDMGQMRLHTKRDGWWGYEANGQWVRTIEVSKASA